MRLHPRQFIRFLDGRAGDQTVIAFLPGDLGARIPTLATDVLIKCEYANKLRMKHHLLYEHFSIIQPTIDKGVCIRSEKSGQLEFLYADQKIFGSRFLLVLKAANGGREVWLVTFFRTNDAQIKSKLRRAAQSGTIVRAAIDDEWDG
jgi:hypothetical protein